MERNIFMACKWYWNKKHYKRFLAIHFLHKIVVYSLRMSQNFHFLFLWKNELIIWSQIILRSFEEYFITLDENY